MHLKLLEGQLLGVIAVIVFGTFVTMLFTADLFYLFNRKMILMNEVTRLAYEIWVYLQAEPLFWLTLTVGSYLLADYIYRASGLFPLLNPVAISILFVSSSLIIFDIDYERYLNNGAKFIHFLLGPATVALAVPNLFR